MTQEQNNNIYLTNTVNTATILTPLDISTQSTIIPIRNSIQSNSRLMGIKKRKKRFKKPIELRKVLPKNSLMLLHELMPNVEYRFVKQNGPIHKPIFTMSVDISEHTFEGIGKTKKEARMVAADKALTFLMEFPEFIQKNKSIKDPNISEDKNDDSLNDDENEVQMGDDDDDGDDDDNERNKKENIQNSNILNNNNCENECIINPSELNTNGEFLLNSTVNIL